MSEEVNFDLLLVEEEAVAEVQTMVLRLLRDKKMTQKELSEKMGVTQSYVSQLLGDEPPNLSIKKAASVFYHLGEPLLFKCDRIEALDKIAWAEKNAKRSRHDKIKAYSSWIACNGNDGASSTQEPIAA